MIKKCMKTVNNSFHVLQFRPKQLPSRWQRYNISPAHADRLLMETMIAYMFFFSIMYTEKEFQQAMHSHINKVHKGLHLLTCMFYTTSQISQHKDLNITWKPTKHCQISSYKSTQLFKLSNKNIIDQSNMKILKDKFKGKKPLFSPKMNDRFHFKIINHFVNNSLTIYILATTSRFPSFI